MRYEFNRDSIETRQWDKIISGMKETLIDVRLGLIGEKDLTRFCENAINDAQPNDKFADALFWGFDEPKNMPSDIRCKYYYQPTYLMTLTLTNAVLQFPALMEIDRMKDTLSKALKACTGRGLHGHGYDSIAELNSNLRLFLRGDILEFLALYPAQGKDFSEMLDKIMASMKHSYDAGKFFGDWEHNYSEEMEKLMALYDHCKKKAEVSVTYLMQYQ